jgi:catechol 2,3-dioxygenase-like lactoylglutathione lyase family enzyme
MRIAGLDHVQLAMPPGGEERARAFYAGLLGLTEVAKPEPLASRGGCWFTSVCAHGKLSGTCSAPVAALRSPCELGRTVVHLGVEPDFAPARKAHPAFLVEDLESARRELAAAGAPVVPDDTLPDVRRFYTADPFGNRIELIERGDGFSE